MLRKIAGACGITSQLVILSVLLVLSLSSPWFSWTEDNLSDYGIRGSLTSVYNSGLVLAGILSTVFAIGLRKNISLIKLGRHGMTSLIFGSLCVSLLGVLPKSLGILHDTASAGSFILIATAMILIGVALTNTSHMRLGVFSVAIGVIPIILWLIPWQWNGDAIAQLFYFGSWSLWTIVSSVILLNNSATVTVKQEV